MFRAGIEPLCVSMDSEGFITADLSPDHCDALLSLCASFGARAVKSQIRAESAALEAIVRQLALDLRADVSEFMALNVARGPDAPSKIVAAPPRMQLS
jgi:hypothetical protein